MALKTCPLNYEPSYNISEANKMLKLLNEKFKDNIATLYVNEDKLSKQDDYSIECSGEDGFVAKPNRKERI